MELQSPTNTAHRPKRRTQPILAATDGGRSTFGLIYGPDPGRKWDRGPESPRQPTPNLPQFYLVPARRDQAVDISSEVMSVAEGVHQILFIPWAGRERTTFGMEEGETGSYYEYTWAHGTSPSGLLGILSEDLVRPSAQDLKIEGTEKVQATAVYGSATPGPWSSYSLQTVLAQAIKRPKAYTHGMVVCGTILSKHQHYKCDFRDTRKEHAIVARRGVVRTPEKVGIPRGPSHHQGHSHFRPMSTGAQATNAECD